MSRKTKIKTTPKIKTYKQNPLYWKSIIGLDNIITQDSFSQTRINNAKKYITRKNNEKIIKNNQEKK